MHKQNPVFSSKKRGFMPAQLPHKNLTVPQNAKMQPITLSIPDNASSKAAFKSILADFICQICFNNIKMLGKIQ